MQAKLAKNAGFCAGVRRAVKIAQDALSDDGKWYSLGVLVHNDDVVNHFIDKGLQPVDSLEQIKDYDAGLIIRSHGVSPLILNQASQQGLKIKDATCPLVKKVHDIVARLRGEDYEIVIFGDINHPEVQGIMGWCDDKATVVTSVDDLNDLQFGPKVGIVSQTTKDQKDYQTVTAALLAKYPEARVFNTICPATRKRQEAARLLCRDVDMMLVIGDKKSSNTRTLGKECISTGVKTFQVQNASEIDPEWLKGIYRVGVTAGASTPDWIIKEVLDRMTAYDENNGLVENQQKMEQVNSAETPANEESFAKLEAEMADLASPNKGDVIKGIVIQVLDDEVMVDVGGKSEGIVPLREMSIKDVASAKELVSVGDTIEVMVLKWDDDGTILLSKKKVESKKVLDELEKSYQEGKIIEGTVTGSVKGGLLVDVGVVAFLPASHVDDGYVKNLEEYVNQTLSFKIIEFNRNKRRGSQIVLSRKELVAEEKAKLKKQFWEEIEEEQTRKGKIKRLVDYGAFIDLGGYEGLLHVSEIAHNRIAHPSDVLTEGDEIDIYILGVDREKERVSLSRKKLLKSPWEIVLDKYQEGDIIDGTVVRIAPFGAFVEIEPGVDGLVHISQLANRRVEKPDDVVKAGDQVKVKILSIDSAEKRIGLSIKEAQSDAESSEVQEFLDNQNEE